MNFQDFVFYSLSSVVIIAALGVITLRNPVHSALLLVLVFVTSSGLWLLLEAEFLAITLVLVYVGAIMVLFLFVVMMLDIDVAGLKEGYVRYLPVGLVVAVVMLLQILAVIGVRARSVPFAPQSEMAETANTAWVAYTLFTDYLLPFEIAALILTVAVIAAVVLTLRRREGTKHQKPGDQSRVKAADRVRLVSMPAEALRSTRDAPSGGRAPDGEDKA